MDTCRRLKIGNKNKQLWPSLFLVPKENHSVACAYKCGGNLKTMEKVSVQKTIIFSS